MTGTAGAGGDGVIATAAGAAADGVRPHGGLTILPGDPLDPDLDLLFQRHHDHCHADTPPESIHMMNRADLVAAGVRFLVMRLNGRAIGMGGLKPLPGWGAEVKSMHVLAGDRGQGRAARLLEALIAEARAMSADTLWLETGAQASFAPARAFYARAGFVECGPFMDYRPDPMSAFMRLDLGGGRATACSAPKAPAR